MFVFLTERKKISKYRVISNKKKIRFVHKIKALLICYVNVFTFHENFGMQNAIRLMFFTIFEVENGMT